MVVTEHEQWGTIGGGALEYTAAAHARALSKVRHKAFQFEEFPLGPALGQCCGGRVLLSYENFNECDRDWLNNARKSVANGRPVFFERRVPDGRWERSDIEPSPRERTISFTNVQGDLLEQPIPARETIAAIREVIADQNIPICVFGAGHVGSAIVQYLRHLPVSVTWIDRRESCFSDDDDETTIKFTTDEEIAAVGRADANACFFVMTHDHQLDYNLVREILKRGDSAYCGLIGSKTKRARFEKRLRREGVDDAQIAHLRCPIGDAGINSKLPAIIALSAIHEMLQSYETHTKVPE